MAERLGVRKGQTGLFYTLLFAMLASGFASTLLGTLLPDIKGSYNLDYTLSGGLLSAHYVGNVSALLLAGVLPVALGRKASILLLGSGIIAGFILISLFGQPLILVSAFFLTGLSRGAWSNIGNTTVGEIAANRVAALNILHAVFAIGAVLCPVLLLLITGWLGMPWRAAAYFASLMGLAVFVLFFVSPIEGRAVDGKAKSAAAGAKTFLRSPVFWLATGILFFYLGAEASIVGWLVSYFGENGLLPSSVATLTPTLLWLAILVGRLLCAGMAKRFDRRRLLLAMALMSLLFFVLMITIKQPVLVIMFLMLLGASMAGIAPTNISILTSYSSTMATGICMGIGTLGAVIMPGVVGAVADKRGLASGIALISFFCVGMLLLMVVDLIRGRSEAKNGER